MMIKFILPLAAILLIFSCRMIDDEVSVSTCITKWQQNKKTAISVTYDDGIITQFTVAKPIMDKLRMPATFYVITGKIEGAQKGKFIGRSPDTIIAETAKIKTNEDNFFERASLIAFTGTTEAIDYHSRAGSLYEAGKIRESYALIDEGYQKIRNGTIKDLDQVIFHDNAVDTTSWEDLKIYQAEGHEIASHTVTHPRLAVLDEPNLMYELKQSKEDIAHFLGKGATFTAECPYGTEDERVMQYAHEIYPALRNRMPEIYLEELNRSSRDQPGRSDKEYVQWQRGPLTRTSMSDMKGWVDTCLAHDNIWLVLVFHGVDDYGWEPKTKKELEEYFSYIYDREDDIWVATFADVTKYIRARKNTKIESDLSGNKITITIKCDLDPTVYDVPLTFKTYIPASWSSVKLGNTNKSLVIQEDVNGPFVLFSSTVDQKELILEQES